MPKRRRWQDATSEVEHFCERAFTVQLVDGRSPDHSIHSDLWSQRWDEQRVAILQAVHIGPHSVQKQVVSIHFFHELLAAIVFKSPERAARCYSSSGKQRV